MTGLKQKLDSITNDYKSKLKSSLNDESDQLYNLGKWTAVNMMMMNLSDVLSTECTNYIKTNNPKITSSPAELINACTQEFFQYAKSLPEDNL